MIGIHTMHFCDAVKRMMSLGCKPFQDQLSGSAAYVIRTNYCSSALIHVHNLNRPG